MNYYFDAHNHYHDRRLAMLGRQLRIDTQAAGIASMVVNGTCEQDWPTILELAQDNAWIVPAFGYHPWFLESATPNWQTQLELFLDQIPSTIGEIGLDRSKRGSPFKLQKQFFYDQLNIASKRGLVSSIHCIAAWGALVEILSDTSLHLNGFLLHSYSGSAELISTLVELGGYFSFSGSILHDKNKRRLTLLAKIPSERLLIETDAPFQPLPLALTPYQIRDPEHQTELNHPANLPAIYRGFAQILKTSVDSIAEQIQRNYHSLFGTWMRS